MRTCPQPTQIAEAPSPLQRSPALTNPFDDAIAKGSDLALSAAPVKDKAATTLGGIKMKLARATQLFQEDKISEAELAGRLSREIDRHEKCRRHWPHLGKLEAAQEIRVHDARNNLEVANRAMERARRELKDAEGLVMAARQEHNEYESERTGFMEFKKKYDSENTAAKQRERNVQLYQTERTEEKQTLHLQEERLAQLHKETRSLELKEWNAKQNENKAADELRERLPTQLKIKFAKGQELAQVSSSSDAKPILSHVSHGIAIPSDASSAHKVSSASSAADAYRRLKNKAQQLKQQEVKAFAELPQDERKVRAWREKERDAERKEGLERSKLVVAKEQLRTVQDHGMDAKKLKLAEDKVQLAQVNLEINDKTESKAHKEIAALRTKEQAGPKLSRALSSAEAELRQMREDGADRAVLQGAGQRLRAVAASGPGGKARETELVMKDTKMQDKTPIRTQSKSELRKELSASRSELQSIRKKLLAVRSKMAAQRQEVGVHQQQLTARTHEVKHATTLLKDERGMPTQQLYSAYEEKLKDLVEERKKADGMLAKATRMLNIARMDSLHASKTKKYALEELKYSTDKLRRYQDLRSKSQECQMDAWSEIRRLTHNARQKKLLAASDESKVEALKVLLNDAHTQDLAQV
eukprot:CAMPEP_0196759478 /NCGR_PEP_ID=MMETSP1091-20130531/104720_1 /TAXON_ID=302021 /ORGANISM="Rhodomonas sp., Strain CCMP768" /LENGTH=643 /DNA_ID=CAMNT_0042108329 /DNA_START=414 /DNA_END=2345 /DNA_ORIENTATION=-